MHPPLKSLPRSQFSDILLFALLYFGVARLSLLVAFADTNASPVWPASGLAAAWMLHKGFRTAGPGIWLGAFAVNLVTFLQNGKAAGADVLMASFLIAFGNTFEAAAFRKLGGNPGEIDRNNFPPSAGFRIRRLLAAPLSCGISAGRCPDFDFLQSGPQGIRDGHFSDMVDGGFGRTPDLRAVVPDLVPVRFAGYERPSLEKFRCLSCGGFGSGGLR
jgi:hypothetical protein